MANQLYVQSVLLTALIETILQTATLYYAQRKPHELGHFRWVVDAKGGVITPYEGLWSKMVMPFLQAKSLREPFIQLRQADYGAFAKFCAVKAEPPRHLRQAAGNLKPLSQRDPSKGPILFEIRKRTRTTVD